ncbi:hypothetical protein BDY21DRAFT_335692 [Lineolata rhizophorae]|uniref:Fe2OG dioxygenase domain-containing protein n=1 Tax=Lineolata rhizophorae TaxID=578093 RepID=A0A6A6P9P9_9PEZI|nr:hypothetical protein BDY21DRAFT_335692 [Lineolata rhizophorae]
MVRYQPGQKFDLHHDWYPTLQRLKDGRRFNRIASFFVYLEDDCAEGETYFPYIETGNLQRIPDERKFHVHEDGGIAFPPIAGNAVFWVNLLANGTGDMRVMHAGLPVVEGLKTAMNLWPRRYAR